MKILLANDDGYESTALIPTIEVLEGLGDLHIVVPSKNQSWTSKSNTRSAGRIAKTIKEIEGHEVITLDALPADCANYGLYSDPRPDLLITGANLGHNVGISAYYASGTIGAAFEGIIAGVPSISISVPSSMGEELTGNDFRASVTILPQLISSFMQDQNGMAMLMVNLPLGVKNTSFVPSFIDHWNFGKLFNDFEDYIEPIAYPKLNQTPPIARFSDTWCRKHKLSSLVALDVNGQVIDQGKIQQWLIKNKLFDHSAKKIKDV